MRVVMIARRLDWSSSGKATFLQGKISLSRPRRALNGRGFTLFFSFHVLLCVPSEPFFIFLTLLN